MGDEEHEAEIETVSDAKIAVELINDEISETIDHVFKKEDNNGPDSE